MNVEIVYLTVFGLFGLAPFAVKINPKKSRMKSTEGPKYSSSKIGLFYSFFLIILILGLSSLYFWKMYYTQIPNESSITRRIRISLKVAGTVTIVAIWANYCLKHSKIVKTANNFTAMNTKIFNICNLKQSQKKYAIFYLLIILHIALSAANLYTTYVSNDGFDVGILTNVFDSVICLHILQYAIILGIIRTKFEDMHSKLSELSDNHCGVQRYFTFVNSKNDKYDTLVEISTIRQSHAVFVNVCDNVSQLYGMSILFSLTYSFGIIVYYSYYALLYSMILAEKSLINTIDAGLPLISVVVAVTAVCILANEVTEQLRKFADVVYKLLDHSFQREIKAELEIFSYEVSHRKITFQACNIFSIDCGLLRSIFTVTATYLILLLQVHSAKK